MTYKKENSGFLIFAVISLCFVFEIDFVSALLIKNPSEYFDGI